MLNPADAPDVPDDVVEAAQKQALRLSPGLTVTAEASTGAAAHDLLEHSEGAEAVVVGAHGRGVVRESLGSVSLQVAMHAKCPVVVVRGHQTGQPSGPVVVGIDGSALSREALGYAFEQASLQARLVAILAWWIEFIDGVVVTSPGSPEWRRLEDQLRLTVAETMAGWQEKYPDVVVDERIEHALLRRPERGIRRGDPRRRRRPRAWWLHRPGPRLREPRRAAPGQQPRRGRAPTLSLTGWGLCPFCHNSANGNPRPGRLAPP